MAEANIWLPIIIPIIPGVIGVVGSLLGAFAGGTANYKVQMATAKRQRRNERASLAVAFATEIRAHIESVQIRRQADTAAECIDALKNGSLQSAAVIELIGNLWSGDKPDEDLPV